MGDLTTRRWWRDPRLLLAALMAAHVVFNVIWIHQDWTLRAIDEAPHVIALTNARGLISTGESEHIWQAIRGEPGELWPSAGYLPHALLSLVFGSSIDTLRLLNLMWLGVLLASLYFIGRRLHSPGAGLLAAALASLYPLIHGASRQYGGDFPATAMVSLCFALLLASDRFRRPIPGLLLGPCVGLAVLARPTSLFFFVPPALLLFVWGLARPGTRSRLVVALTAVAGGVLAAGTSAVWWAGRVPEITNILQAHQAGSEMGMQDSSLLYYLRSFPIGASAVMMLAFAVSLYGHRRLKEWTRQPERVAVWFWLLGGLAIISSIQEHLIRYQMPLFPALALITTLGLLSIPHGLARRLTVALVLAAGMASWLLCSMRLNEDRCPTEERPDQRCATSYQCGPWDYSGAPDVDRAWVVAHELSARLQQLRRDHRHVLVQIPFDERLVHQQLVATAVLRTKLVQVRVLGKYGPEGRDPFAPPGDPLQACLGGAALPEPAGEYQACYTLLFKGPDFFDEDRTAREVYRRMEQEPFVTLWQHRCPD